MNGPYENLMHNCHLNEACEYLTESTISGKQRNKLDSSRGGADFKRTALLVVLLGLALASIGVSGWVHYSVRHRCKFATFVLDTRSLTPCGQPRSRPAPCAINSSHSGLSGAYLTSQSYNNAVGPWKLGNRADREFEGQDDGGNCGIELERLGTHLVVGESGLYQLTTQATFTDDNPAHLEWQVDHAEWIAASRGREPQLGPSQTRLEAVRRLTAGQKLSLHLDKGEKHLATDASATFITLVRL